MVDPLSITTAAVSLSGACWKISIWLYKWIDETKSSDDTVKTFASELTTLSTILDSVKTTCSQNRPKNPTTNAEHDNALWTLVETSIADCTIATGKLEKLLEGIGTRKGIGLAITNWNLNLQSDNITRLREQIQNQKGVLQITMQTISVQVLSRNLIMQSHSSSTHALTDLSLKVDTLLKYVTRAEASNTQKLRAPSTAVNGDNDEDILEDNSAQQLEQCTIIAKAVASSASSVIAEGMSTIHGRSGEDRVVLGSDYGDMEDTHRLRIEGWIPTLTLSEETADGTTFLSEDQGSSLQGRSIFSGEDDSEPTNLSEMDSLTQVGSPGPDADFDTNQDLELFWVFLRKANALYNQSKYGESERYYVKALERSEKVPTGENVNEIRKKIALGSFEQGKWSDARKHFSMIPGSENLFAEMCLDAGIRKIDCGEYFEACTFFGRALESPENFPSQTLRNIHGQAGIAHYKQEHFLVAETHFISVTDLQGEVPDLRSLEAEHYLAVIYFHYATEKSLRDLQDDGGAGYLDRAEQHCLVASKGRRRILGKFHELWRDSVALLAEIYEFKGDAVEAEGYRALLPVDCTSKHYRESKFKSLCANYSLVLEMTQRQRGSSRNPTESREDAAQNTSVRVAIDGIIAIDRIMEFMRTTYHQDLQKSTYFTEEFWPQIRESLSSQVKNQFQPSGTFTLLHLLTLLGLESEIKYWLIVCPTFPVSVKDSRFLTPFRLAIQTSHMPLISLFLSRPEFDPEKESSKTLHDLAIQPATRDVFKCLVFRKLIDINDKMGMDRNTPLMLACQRGDVPMVQFLLSQDCLKINAGNSRDETALISAAASGYLEIVELLLVFGGIDVNAKATLGATALSMAKTQRHEQIVQLLKSHGAVDRDKEPAARGTGEPIPPTTLETNANQVLDSQPSSEAPPVQRLRSTSTKRPRIRLVAHSDAKPTKRSTLRMFREPAPVHPSLNFNTITRTLPDESAVLTLGRYSESGAHDLNPAADEPSAAPIGFKTKVVSRQHCQLSCTNGQWHVKDVGSSSGTFLNGTRLSPMNKESSRYQMTDGDILQLGTNFRGGEELIFRRVKIKVEILS